jgi:cation diffusion facilitator CzcD-associated flavoprotein CzcO
MIRDDCEVAVIGAGPYGLSVAAHLNAANVATRVFGEPMSFWQRHMPRGMYLRSPWVASHLADPAKTYSLDVYASKQGIAQHYPLPIEHFISYGNWFQRSAVPNLDLRKVIRVEQGDSGFRLRLDDGTETSARRVVVALGLAHQDFRPEPFVGLPAELVSHASEHDNLDGWRGKRVAVIGRGQSACESAALLSEGGAEVEMICRGDIRWLGVPQKSPSGGRSWLKQLRARLGAPSEVGPFPMDWFNELPALAHRMPTRVRDWIAVRSLRPASAGWVRPRFERVRVSAGCAIVGARARDHDVALELDIGSRTFDRVLLATGYRIDISKIGIWAPELLQRIERTGGSPNLSRGFESSVPGLHFVGSSAVHSYGPLMRFVVGAGYAARSITRKLARHHSRPAAAGAKHINGAAYGGSAGTLSRP